MRWGTPNTDNYYNANWQLLETRKDGDVDPLKQYIWDQQYIDALVVRFYDADTDGSAVAHYATFDANMNLTAILDTSGNVVQRFSYDTYGQSHALDPDFTAYTGTDLDWRIRFQGTHYDAETGLHHVRNRMYHPTLGRWITRDPLGYPDGMNSYAGYHILHGSVDSSGLFLTGCSHRDRESEASKYSCCDDPNSPDPYETRTIYVSIHVYNYYRAKPITQGEIDYLNKIWGQCCIKFEAVAYHEVSQQDTYEYFGKRNILDTVRTEYGRVIYDTREATKMARNMAGSLNLASVRWIEIPEGAASAWGFSFSANLGMDWKYGSNTNTGIAVVSPTRKKNVLAQEIGNTMGLRDIGDSDNVMMGGRLSEKKGKTPGMLPRLSSSTPGDELTDGQCDQARRFLDHTGWGSGELNL